MIYESSSCPTAFPALFSQSVCWRCAYDAWQERCIDYLLVSDVIAAKCVGCILQIFQDAIELVDIRYRLKEEMAAAANAAGKVINGLAFEFISRSITACGFV